MKRNLPPVKENLHDLDKLAKPSIDVLVKTPHFKNILIGRYYHGSDCWHVEGIHSSGDIEVVEWWPMPVIGTGTKVNPVNQDTDDCACLELGSQCDACDEES